MEPSESVTASPARALRFWAIVAALAASKLELALEMAIVSTALPTIVHTQVPLAWAQVTNRSPTVQLWQVPSHSSLHDNPTFRLTVTLSDRMFVFELFSS